VITVEDSTVPSLLTAKLSVFHGALEMLKMAFDFNLYMSENQEAT
jgi:hypothetical protein